jgi:hypothetical protein
MEWSAALSVPDHFLAGGYVIFEFNYRFAPHVGLREAKTSQRFLQGNLPTALFAGSLAGNRKYRTGYDHRNTLRIFFIVRKGFTQNAFFVVHAAELQRYLQCPQQNALNRKMSDECTSHEQVFTKIERMAND